MRASAGFMQRKSCARASRASSTSAPASSMPVGPPPTITKVSRARRRAGSVSRSAASNAVQDAPADLDRVVEVLEARREPLPVVATEVGVARAGREDQVVVRDRAAVSDDAPACRVDIRHGCHHHRGVLALADEVPNRLCDVARR